MEWVRDEERRAELLAHILDDAVRVPGTAMRFGVDPVIGIAPIVGDAVVTMLGVAIILIARRLGVPIGVLVQMSYNLLLNGAVGAIPALGDAFSFWFKSNSKNTALLLRTLARGKDAACPLTAKPLTMADILLVLGLTLPIVLFVASLSFWLWNRGVSIV